jgi:excisionase family DNA binding protein
MGRSLTTGEIAEYCQVNLRTVIRWIDGGKLKGYKLPGRGNNRVLQEDFLVFLKEYDMPIPDELMEQVSGVLIVDDEPAYAQAIKRALQEYSCVVVSNGFDAGLSLKEQRPALMTLDLSMPGMDGYQVIKTVRSDDDLSDLKILVISALDQEALDKAVEFGANAAISKPFENDHLRKTVEALMR